MKKQLYKTLKKSADCSSLSSSSESGFSLVELAVIVVIMGVFAAIAAPSWDALVTRQRIRSVNNQVLQALQTAQAEARRTKQDIEVTFNNTAGVPAYTIGDQSEQLLNLNGEIKEGQLQLSVQANNDNSINSITFNHIGAITQPDLNNNGQNTDGFTITVFNPNGGARRCVKVVTLLGAMKTSEGGDCP